MPTYDQEVLTDNPIGYWKIEEPVAVDPLVDSSGNGYDGTFFTSDPFPVLGIAGPIETDPVSHGGSSRIATIDIGSGHALDVRDAFTWEVWGYLNGTVQDYVQLTRQGSFGLTGSNLIGFNSGVAFARISVGTGGGNTYDLSSGSLTAGAWYHMVVTRSTNVMRLYVNGVLKAERTDLPITSIVYASYNNANWTIGASLPSGTADYSEGTSRVAIYDSALTAARVLAHYEAAKATLPLSATITIRVVVELDTDQVVPVDFPFVHNFAEAISGQARPIVEHLAFKTNINQSEPDYQQRVNAQPYHAERTLEYFVTPTSARARSMLHAALWTPAQTYKVPVGNDWSQLTAQATAGANTLSVDTIKKDYEVNSYVVAFEDVYQPWTAQFFQITSRTDPQLGISPNVGTTLPIGSPVMPARLAILPDDSLSVDSHLIDRETHALQFEILSTELSSRRVTTYTPSATYLSIEVFSLERSKVEWLDPSQYQISRRVQGTGTPTGNDYQRAIDTGSSQTIPLRVLLTSRAAISEFYGWMNARQGKQNPVWIVSEEADINVMARSATTITIDYIGYTLRYNTHSARRHIAFKKTDGSVVYKMVTAAVNNGNITETLSVSNPPALADIAKTSFLRLATAPDQFELRYHRNGAGFIAECEFVMTELLTTPE